MHHILVVDDDPTIATALAHTLQLEGFDAQVVANGQDALAVSEQQPPVLILLDLMMPIMDGWAFLRERLVRPSLAAVPVIVLSARHNAWSTLDGLNVTHCLKKPFDLDEVLTLVGQHVQPA